MKSTSQQYVCECVYMANDKILFELKMSQQWKLHFKKNREGDSERSSVINVNVIKVK